MPRLAGVVSEMLFTAVDTWRRVKRNEGHGPKWDRQDAIQRLTLQGIAAEAKNDPELLEALEDAALDLSEYEI